MRDTCRRDEEVPESDSGRPDVRRRGERLLLAIANPRDGAAPSGTGAGIGIENVRRRLESVYGREAELRLQAGRDSFHVELELPAAPAEGEYWMTCASRSGKSSGPTSL